MISRRLFLCNTAAAGAVGAVATPAAAAAAEPTKPPHEMVLHYADKLAEAMGRANPTMGHLVTINFDCNFVLVTGHKKKATKVFLDDGSPLRADDVTGTTAFTDWEASA